MGLQIFVLDVLLLVLALLIPALRVARRPVRSWTRTLAVVMGLLAVVLVVFLFVEDDYTRDGRSNWRMYDVEYPTVPTVLGLLLGARYLLRHEGSRHVAVVAPLIAVGSSFAAFVCFLFTTN